MYSLEVMVDISPGHLNGTGGRGEGQKVIKTERRHICGHNRTRHTNTRGGGGAVLPHWYRGVTIGGVGVVTGGLGLEGWWSGTTGLVSETQVFDGTSDHQDSG